MDVLSDVLKAVTLQGAVFYNAEFSAPWGFRAPHSRQVRPLLAPNGGHIIMFHLLTEGRGSARLDDGDSLPLVAGDIVVFPHGDAHVVQNGVWKPSLKRDVERVLSRGLRVARGGGGGEVTKFVCGYMACEPRLGRIVLAGLPAVFKVHIRDDAAGRWLEDSLRFSVDAASQAGPGGEAVLARLSEALFIETLRRYVAQWPEGRTGWLAGARDPEVGRALALMHRRPAHPWSLAELAREAGLSRSALAERFRNFMREPPMAYLTRWRLQLGARILGSSNRSVADVAAEVGYESEAAFNRAFKRAFGIPPARFRTRSRSAAESPVKPRTPATASEKPAAAKRPARRRRA